ncbi:YdcF family protein, partial [Mycobacterium kansasii]
IVVTGGVEQAGRTEGALMKNWLVERGVDAARVTDENFARTTVENALYSSYVLATKRVEHAIVVSSASHVRRGAVDLMLAARENLPATFTV